MLRPWYRTVKNYKPEFEMSDNFSSNIEDRKVGQSLQAIVNFEVIERTRNYTIIRIHYLFPVDKKRVY